MIAILLSIAYGLVSVAFLFATFRLVRGPTMTDRVIALDLLTTLAVGFLAVHAQSTGHTIYLDVALGLGLVAFIGTVAFGALIESDRGDDDQEERT